VGLAPASVDELVARFGARLPFGGTGESGILTIHCPEKAVFALVGQLSRSGADEVTVSAPAYVFRKANPLLERLLKRI
jgi:ATP phosphoribosyltransferase